MTDISPTIKSLLDEIITHQEGGWVLTENKDDLDGGWTYAGVTHKTFAAEDATDNEEYKENLKTTYSDMLKLAADVKHINFMHDFVYHIYYSKYCIPLDIEFWEETHRGAILSCAINCGVETAIKLVQTTIEVTEDGKLGKETRDKYDELYNVADDSFFVAQFPHHWALYYCELVRENAEAWREYAIAAASENSTSLKEPATLRATNLSGWINRIEYWRSK